MSTSTAWLFLLVAALPGTATMLAHPAITLADPATAPVNAVTVTTAAVDTTTTSYEIGGLRVIHRRRSANEIVAVNLYLLGGSAQLDSATAGIEAMLLRVSEYGTHAYPGRETRMAMARTGSRTMLSPGPDWTIFGFRGLRSEFDSTWSVFADRLMRPSLEPAAIEVVRGRMVRWARNETMHPDERARQVASRIVFAGHPYRHDPEGTEASLAGMTAEALRAYLDSHVVTSRMLLVVVGDIERERLDAAIARSLAQLPRGSYTWSLPPAWSTVKAAVTVVEQPLPTNYILGYFAGPPSDSRDYQAFRIATRILGSIAHSDIRDHGLSYAAGAPFLDRAASGGGVYVTTTRPDTAIRTFNHTITGLKEHVVQRAALQRYFKGFITEYYALNESNAEQAHFLARHQLLRGDWRLAARYMDDLKAISGPDIRRVARQYMKNIQYVYVGNGAIVPTRDMTKH
jgi:zinc protease